MSRGLIKSQMKAIAKAKPLVEQALTGLCGSVDDDVLPTRMVVADLGCSSGPNALVVAAEIVGIVREASGQLGRAPPEIQYFLNDLPGNDFNTLLRYVASFQEKLRHGEGQISRSIAVPFYASAVAGSFYGRLFPDESVHFVHSSNSLHFLSQVPQGVECEDGNPLNKQNIYLSESSPPRVFQSYLEQFKKDFTLFLKLRYEEITSDGCMVLVFLGRSGVVDPSNGECCHLWKLLADALMEMVSENLIEEAKVDSFNLPFYAPSVEELREVIYSEGSFDIMQYEVFEMNWDPTSDLSEDIPVAENLESTGENVASCIRAVVESMLKSHFGEAISIDDLFSRYARNVSAHLSKQGTKYFKHIVYLKKRAPRKSM